jgi:hypothetical protein
MARTVLGFVSSSAWHKVVLPPPDGAETIMSRFDVGFEAGDAI